MTTQDQVFYTACQLVEYRQSYKSRLNATTWTLLCELGIAARLPTKRGCRGGRTQQQQRISTEIGHRPITKCTTTAGMDNLIHITRVTTPCLYSDSSHINVCCEKQNSFNFGLCYLSRLRHYVFNRDMASQ